MIILKILLLAWFITKFEPISWILEILEPSIPKNNISTLIFNISRLSLGCLKCASFYIGLIMGGFWVGCLSSFIAYLYMNTIQPQIDKLRFH